MLGFIGVFILKVLMEKRQQLIIGLTRVRNESLIIQETLDHLSEYCDGGIFVFDDCSTDGTVSICKSHPNVIKVIKGSLWDENRARAEFENRQSLLTAAKKHAKPNDWFVYLDADERVEFDWSFIKNFSDDVIAVRMKLFDFYITPEDIDKKYYERKWLGPEFREIIMAFKNSNELCYAHADQREVSLGKGTIKNLGYVKHYGKAISIEEWEKTCDYYGNHFPQYSEKWKKRKGKAVHINTSDFGNNLISWNEKEEKGFLLVTEEINKSNLKILISTHHLLDYTGSEIYTVTLAEHLKLNGCDVTVYSKYTDRTAEEFKKLDIPVFDNLDAIKNNKYDAAHVHHNINAAEVRYYFPKLPIVFLSHGVLPFLEQPSEIELNISKYLAVSDEVKQNLIKNGVAENKISVRRNLIDERKFVSTKKINEHPANALVISSRIDLEKENIIRVACRKQNINLKFVGGRFGQTDQNNLIALIEEADIVFSLGRGAIEAMFMGRIPIIYDYQGGDGLITLDNFEEIMKCNFSGRRFKINFTVHSLINEINNYDASQSEKIREKALQYYSAEKLSQELIEMYKSVLSNKVEKLVDKDTALLEFFVKSIEETRNYTTEITSRLINRNNLHSNANAALILSELLIEKNELNAAKIILEQSLNTNCSNLDSLNNLAVVHIMQQNYNEALSCLKRVIDIQPQNEVALDNLVYLQELISQPTDSVIQEV